jgi:diguanylate cyclase (GGDEF)-like protein
MLDQKGRIVGWFSWEPERPATAMMNRLLPLAASIALGLLGFAALAMWQLGRLGFQLAKSEQHAQKLELEDMLTGLPNHNRFFALLDQAVAARQGEQTLVLAVLDLDGFDEVNDALGYAGGDEVLAEVAKRLAQSLPAGAVLGRLGSDEFALLIADVDPQAALQAADALRRSLLRPFWMNQVVQVSVSIGLAIAPRDGVTRDELTRRADLALRTA